jgi:hypothetical protein
MTNLTEFLLARIEEDEKAERFVSQRHVGAGRIAETVEMVEPSARMLAECKVKRRIIEVMLRHEEILDDPHAPTYYEVPPVLRLLALMYADHPDYRDEWKL